MNAFAKRERKDVLPLRSPVAFVFPGQGSQHLGMLAALASEYPKVEELFATVSKQLGYDLWALTQYGPLEQLNETEYTQAAMLTADVAVYSLLQERLRLNPGMMAGHSLGEYAALVCSRSITLSNAAMLVSMRGRLMQETVPVGQGAMAVIVGLVDEQVEQLCKEVSSQHNEVLPANYNSVGQVVIAGHLSAVERAIERAETYGARMAKIIPVSVPCHCSLLNQAAHQFEKYLEKAAFNTPSVPVISNVDLSVYNNPQHIKQLLAQQLFRPVRWVETILKMKQNGVRVIVECGPGKVLSGLIKRIDSSLKTLSIHDPLSFHSAIAELSQYFDKEL